MSDNRGLSGRFVQTCGRPAFARALLGISVAFASLWDRPALAQPGADFSGKTITIVVGFPPGGDYDAYARLTANSLGHHLPGNPAVVVQNMPGAGGVVAANYLYNSARRDGTVLGVIAQTAAIAQITQVPGIKFEVGKLNWIGRVNSNVEVQQIWHTSPVKSIRDVASNAVTVAGTGSTSSSFVFPTLLDRMFGMKFKVVPGYQGVGMAILAMERGEVSGVAAPWSLIKAKHADWLRDNKVTTILQYVIKKHPDLKDVPSAVDLAQNDLQKQILALYSSGAELGRSITAPPGLPAPVVQALREGVQATMKDPTFLADLKKSGLEFDPMDGVSLQEHVADLLKIPASVVAEARRIMQ